MKGISVSARVLAVWMLSVTGKVCSVRRCSAVKLLTIVFSVIFTWTVMLLLDVSGLLPGQSPFMTRYEDESAYMIPGQEWAENEQVGDYLVQDNPLGTYFSEKLPGSSPLGSPFHASSRQLDHQVPLKTVLVFVANPKSTQVVELGQFFAMQRIEYRTSLIHEDIPSLIMADVDVPRYALIVFDDYSSYLGLEPAKRFQVDSYCRNYSVGIVAIAYSVRKSTTETFQEQKVKLQHGMRLKGFRFNPEIDFWRVVKAGANFEGALPSSDWTIFISQHATYKPLVFSGIQSGWLVAGEKDQTSACIVAVYDVGLLDGISKVILGYDLSYWLNSMLAMDALTHLTNGRLGLPLDRLLQIDIDDMFVGQTGIRTLASDAEEMLKSQNRIRKYIPNFQYKLGFSGGKYMNGTELEKAGDKRIVELASNFVWFNHMFRHEQPHTMDRETLKGSIEKNQQFAAAHDIRVIKEYMVTPHHSGIYPVIESLYDHWRENNVICTSTELYPRHLPQWGRRGFIHKGVMVLPRQTCRLFTRIVTYANYPGGKAELDKSIQGGYLFKVFLTTPIMMFMTHMSNYANDRLAIYAFENVIQFVANWTNLRLLSPPPVEIGRRYFQMYSQEINAVWTNPCGYEKHREIWPLSKSCTKLPTFIIAGPQKTGTTALQKFLEVHPMLLTSKPDPVYYEEIQFFLTKNYQNGIEWYQDHFPELSDPQMILFEKSANYFDNEFVPKRVYALIPTVKIIILLSEPARRAYSWYHNLRFHNDSVAMNYTFFEIVTAPESAPKFLKDVRNRCLKPGMYAVHLSRWLQYFPPEQIILIDSDQLDRDPATVLDTIQKFVHVEPILDYTSKLEYNEEKKFFCLKDTGCLSSNKGRKYPHMDPESKSFLGSYYQDHNTNLKTLLNNIGQPFPNWLEYLDEA
ncbi:Bifunctional heparan sulfate N-deacetylase/N-sulfotransferase 2 [Bulinus truncatus]|nr:Bifunctional heparan sulfate N-deacetylase/N-sulfotransferase 2 [Bulinus truncatus]